MTGRIENCKFGVVVDIDEEFEAFDSLPAAIRRRIQASTTRLNSITLLKAYKHFKPIMPEPILIKALLEHIEKSEARFAEIVPMFQPNPEPIVEE